MTGGLLVFFILAVLVLIIIAKTAVVVPQPVEDVVSLEAEQVVSEGGAVEAVVSGRAPPIRRARAGGKRACLRTAEQGGGRQSRSRGRTRSWRRRGRRR